MSEGSTQTARQLEVQEFLQARVVRKRLLPRAVLVGLGSGLVAVAFRIGLQLCENAREHLLAILPSSPWISFLVIAVIGTIGTYVALLIGRLEPDASGSGIPQMKAVLEGHMKMDWLRILWVKFLGALAALGSGLAMGREGPTVQMGGAVGQGLATLTNANNRERRALSAAGSGAGLAAAFNAPLAGVTFVLEELQRDFQPIVFVAALLCAAVATVISRLASGQFPVFEVPHIEAPSLAALPLFAVVGLLGGFLGVLFNRALLGTQSAFDGIRVKSPIKVALITGILLAIAFVASKDLIGGGHGLSELAIKGEIPLLLAIGFFMLRFVLIHVCYATGVPGGIFAPLLSLGALIGLVSHELAVMIGLQGGVTVAACAVAGMCGMFSGVVRAPLTGVILIGEMTGSYDLLLPLLVTAFAAYAVAENMRDIPIYEALLQRLASMRGFEVEDDERRFVETEIRPDSTLVGLKLKDAHLPKGVLVVLCSNGSREYIPNGNTVLREHMKISVVSTSKKALHDLELLTHSPTADID
ncbi:MAG: H(+)/Cl(-) exchange transporter ClcA [Armatimonadetes bacterium]|nr:H(+)/Cl(-) exchange transporter ClcA [Armatimonadota bacterium]MBS1726007.1 H(+)/Cl(-) exchange transporter ClcA [Armatimonadota bacterium]